MAGKIAKLALEKWATEYGKTHVTMANGHRVPSLPFALRPQPDGTSKYPRAMSNVTKVVRQALADRTLDDPADFPYGVDRAIHRAADLMVKALMKVDDVPTGKLTTVLGDLVTAERNPPPVEDRGFGVSPQDQLMRERLHAAEVHGRPVTLGI